jgi:trimethylamine--corrinoid protein Co-methyltransferase
MGGRAAKQALRAAPIPEDERAVQPGHVSGRYQPLTESEVMRIHQAVLEALEQIGIANAIPSCQDLVTGAGGSMTEEGRLLFPRSLVEDVVASAARDIVLPGQDARYDLHLTGNRTYFGTAGAAVHIVDTKKR